MRYHNITKDDMLNGEGLRTVLWVAGCSHNCPGCHNPVTWDVRGGLPFDEAAKEELFAELEKDYISGVTFSGRRSPSSGQQRGHSPSGRGDPRAYPNKTIWLYTGYDWEQICEFALLKNIDVVVDGEFIEAYKDVSLHWKGSSNQRVIDVQRSLLMGEAVLYEEPDT